VRRNVSGNFLGKEFKSSFLLNKSLADDSLKETLIAEISKQLQSSAEEGARAPEICEVFSISGHSNNILYVNLDDGRSLIVKQSRFEWAGPRFENARRSCTLLRREGQLEVPKHVNLHVQPEHRPVLAYWFIPLPVLKDLWPELSHRQRIEVLRSMGQMLREAHQVKMPHFGALTDDATVFDSIQAYMQHELQVRLKPALWAEWPEASPIADRLTDLVEVLTKPDEGATLVHNDLHLGNVLCKVEKEDVRCVGLLDFESAAAGWPESDLASAIILHDPLFAGEYPGSNWLDNFDEYLLEGYGDTPDAGVLTFFKVYHLLNLGFFSALNDDEWHAFHIAEKARLLLDNLS
jgi:aminoglycoside phosphotransferase (APT) family kinase protein